MSLGRQKSVGGYGNNGGDKVTDVVGAAVLVVVVLVGHPEAHNAPCAHCDVHPVPSEIAQDAWVTLSTQYWKTDS